jgi:TP901 family phage tail tape measure protein
VEKAITAISVVGDQFAGKNKQLSQGLFTIAKATGQSFQEVSKAALEFSRQGLSLEQTLQRTQDALVLTRLTGLDAAKSVDGLTASVNAFSKAGLSTTQIINKLAAVDQAFAVSSADLIEGFNRSAAVAQNAGVTFDELAGIITALQQETSRGGAVIGNALKTIFTRLQDTSTLNQLKGLGVAVQDLEGNLLPARQILQNLAKDVEGLGQITRAGIFKDVAGTFQINQLISLVSDLNKENSVAAAATKKAAGATNEAFVANEKLNQSLDAIINKVTLTGKQIGALLGEIGLADNLKGILDGINSFLEGASNLLQGDDLGSRFAKGIVKGIGSVLTGPGIGLFLAIIAKLSFDLAKFGVQSLKTFFGIGQAAKQQQQVQESIVQTLIRNQSVLSQILNTQGGQNAQAQAFLNILKQEEQVLQNIRTIAGGIAAPLISQGYRAGAQGIQRRSAGGYLPAQEAADVRRGVGGASPSSKVVAIPNFAFGGGKRGTMIANTSEYIVPNYAGGGSAIFNQDMAKTMGLPPGAKKITASGGFVPNFAQQQLRFKNNKLNISEGYLLKQDEYKGLADINKDSISKGAVTFRKTILKISGKTLEEDSKKLVEEGSIGKLKKVLGKAGDKADLDLFIKNRSLKDKEVQSLLPGETKKVSFIKQLRGLQNLVKGQLFERYLLKNRKDIVPYGDKPNEPLDFKFSNSTDPLAKNSLGIEAKAGGFTNHSLIAKAINAKYGDYYKDQIPNTIPKIGTVDLFVPNASRGYIPNFANRNQELAILGLYGENGNIDGSPVYTLKSQRPNLFKDIEGNLKKNVTNLVKAYASRIGKKIGVPVGSKDIKKSLTQIPSLSGYMFEDVLNQLAGPNFDTATESSGSRIDFPLTKNLREVFGVTGTQIYAEAKLNPYSGDALKSIAGKQLALAGGAQGPVERSGDLISGLKAKYLSYKNLPGRTKGNTGNKALFNEIVLALGLDPTTQRDTLVKQVERALGAAAGGYIPNFAASALLDAISREKSAGLSASQIYVDQSPALKSSSNPMGLMVANRRDEPAGGFQGISRARREGVNPKTYGAARGFVPNYAPLAPLRDVNAADLGSSRLISKQDLANFNTALKAIAQELKKGKITLQEAEVQIDNLSKNASSSGLAQKKLNSAAKNLITAYDGEIKSRKQQAKDLRKSRADLKANANNNEPTGQFADLAGKLVVAQTAMSFFTGAVEGSGGQLEKLGTSITQVAGSLTQVFFLLQSFKGGQALIGKFTDKLKGLGNSIKGNLPNLLGAGGTSSRAGGLVSGIGSKLLPGIGAALTAGYVVKTLADGVKGFFTKDLTATFDGLAEAASVAGSQLTDFGKILASGEIKAAVSSIGTLGTTFLELFTAGTADVTAFIDNAGQKRTIESLGTANEEQLGKIVNDLITANIAAGKGDARTRTFDFLEKEGAAGSFGQRKISFEDPKVIEALKTKYKELGIEAEAYRKKQAFATAQKFAKKETEALINRLEVNQNVIKGLDSQYRALRDSILNIDLESTFSKFANKTLIDLNSSFSSVQKSVEEFNNSLREVEIDFNVDNAKALSSELEKINTTAVESLRSISATVTNETSVAIQGIQEIFANPEKGVEDLTKFYNNFAKDLAGVLKLEDLRPQLEAFRRQTLEQERQLKLKQAQTKLDFANKTLVDQQTLLIQKQNGILEKRLSILQKTFDQEGELLDIQRQISDAEFETSLIGKSQTAQLSARRGRVSVNQQRADQDAIREFQKILADQLSSIEIPDTVSSQQAALLQQRRNAQVNDLLNFNPAPRASPEQIAKDLEKLASTAGVTLVDEITAAEKKSSEIAINSAITAANSFSSIVVAGARDVAAILAGNIRSPQDTEVLKKQLADEKSALNEFDKAAKYYPNTDPKLREARVATIKKLENQLSPDYVSEAVSKAQADVAALAETLKGDASKAIQDYGEAIKSGINPQVALTKLLEKLKLNAALSGKELKDLTQQIGELGDATLILSQRITQYLEGLPGELAGLQFSALQSTSPDDLSSNLIQQNTINQAKAEGKTGEEAVTFIAKENALRQKSFELATAESASRRRELEIELQYLEEFFSLKQRTADLSEEDRIAELAAFKRRQIEEQRTFGAGLGRGFAQVQTDVDNFKSQLGEKIPQLFSDNLAQGLNDAISGAKSLKDALRDAATSFFQEITRENISNLAKSFTSGINNVAKGFFPQERASGGLISGGSGVKDDVPAMLMGGEYVIKKSAVKKYGSNFLDALNKGSIKGFANGGGVQSGAGGFYVPGDYGEGSIRGKGNLLAFAGQSFTSGQYDRMGTFGLGGASVSLEAESARLTAFGRENSPLFERVQQSKEEAFKVYLDQLNQEKQYRDQLKQMEQAEKERQKQLTSSIVSAVVTSVASAAAKSFGAGFSNAAASSGASGLSKFGAGVMGGFGKGGVSGQGGLGNLFSGNFKAAFNNIAKSDIIPAGRASGGMIYGGSGTRDDVPAMLTGGEFVLNNRATRKLGVQNLNRLNAGETGGGEDRSGAITESLLSKLDELIQATRESSSENVVVNVSSSEVQGSTENTGGTEKELQRKIRQAVLDVIAQEKRLGGSLNKDNR